MREDVAPPLSDAIPMATLGPARRWLSPAWLIPVLALVFAGAILYQAKLERGPRIVIQFASGSGIEPNDPVTFRGVRVGTVRSVTLTPDLGHVRVEADLRPDASALARAGTSFWVVRPEVSLTRVSGLDTIVGPRYVAAEPAPGAEGGAGGAAQYEFVGLDRPPRDGGTAHAPGDALELTLRAQRLGSVSENSPVTYRDLKVGSVTRITLADHARHIEVSIRVEPQYAYLVRANTRFWNASGIGLDMGLFRGLKLNAQSLETVLAGGVAFATPDKAGPAVADGHVFELEGAAVEDWIKWSPSLGP